MDEDATPSVGPRLRALARATLGRLAGPSGSSSRTARGVARDLAAVLLGLKPCLVYDASAASAARVLAFARGLAALGHLPPGCLAVVELSGRPLVVGSAGAAAASLRRRLARGLPGVVDVTAGRPPAPLDSRQLETLSGDVRALCDALEARERNRRRRGAGRGGETEERDGGDGAGGGEREDDGDGRENGDSGSDVGKLTGEASSDGGAGKRYDAARGEDEETRGEDAGGEGDVYDLLVIPDELSAGWNLCTVYGLLLGYPVCYWFRCDDPADGTGSALDGEPLAVHRAVAELRVPDRGGGGADGGAGLRHTLCSFSVPVRLAEALAPLVEEWRADMRRAFARQRRFCRLELEESRVCLSRVAL
ncbi:UPF0739 protein C1orf74 homolog [Lampetra fluviatilis]